MRIYLLIKKAKRMKKKPMRWKNAKHGGCRLACGILWKMKTTDWMT
jgi:hypothetical protein